MKRKLLETKNSKYTIDTKTKEITIDFKNIKEKMVVDYKKGILSIEMELILTLAKINKTGEL